ncbi:MAG: hypothetical protein ACRC3J_04975 [Culicoidibacterales bacterium]
MNGHWTTKEFDKRKYIGFVYEIIFDNGLKYIGSKKFWKRCVDASEIDEFSEETNWKTYKSSSSRVLSLIESGVICTYVIIDFCTCFDSLIETERNHQMMNDVMNSDTYLNKAFAGGTPSTYENIRRSLISTHKKNSWRDENYRATMKNKISSTVSKLWESDEYRTKIRNTKRANKLQHVTSENYHLYYDYVPTRQEVEKLESARVDRYKRVAELNRIVQKGAVFSDEHKQKMSEAAKNRIVAESTTKKLSETMKAHYKNNPRSQETIDKQRESRPKRNKVILSLTIDDVVYKSVRDASIKLNTSECKIKTLIKREKAVVVYKDRPL